MQSESRQAEILSYLRTEPSTLVVNVVEMGPSGVFDTNPIYIPRSGVLSDLTIRRLRTAFGDRDAMDGVFGACWGDGGTDVRGA
eukprot:51611-Eustigmatos_ZCMA.PRE.1